MSVIRLSLAPLFLITCIGLIAGGCGTLGSTPSEALPASISLTLSEAPRALHVWQGHLVLIAS